MAVSRLEMAVSALRPAALLDVGCGCGHFTSTLARHCPRVVAVDIVQGTSRWPDITRSSGIRFCAMDAIALGFASDSFPLVLERASLHHIAGWPDALAEIVRVSSDHVFVEEPVDDLRSEAKRRTFEAQGLFLALQAEVGYPHFRHLDRDVLLSALAGRAVILTSHLEASDAPIGFDEFFDSFDVFASQSDRRTYWLDRLQELRARFAGAPLCDDDVLTVLAAKKTPPSSL